MGDTAKRPAHARLEQRLERGAARARQQGMKGRSVDHSKVGSRTGYLPLPFEAIDQVGLAPHRLDGLEIAAVFLAHPQEDPRLPEREVGRVEIGRDKVLLLGPPEALGREKPIGLDALCIGGIEVKLELDLLWHLYRLTCDHNDEPQ